jgi:hypothetical protein
MSITNTTATADRTLNFDIAHLAGWAIMKAKLERSKNAI